MAGDFTAIPLLLGLDEFIMSATSNLPARSQISKLSAAENEGIAANSLQLGTVEEVANLVQSHI
jgi:phosphoenolpyruvate-protein phosphotransferase (PTS system enzyme I)